MTQITTDAPMPAWPPPEHWRAAAKAAGLALFELTGRDLVESAAADDLREALESLPGGLYDDHPPATEEEWRRRTGTARELVGRHVSEAEACDLAASLIRIADAALRSLVEADSTARDALRRIRSAHVTAVHEVFMADALDGRLSEALADIRDALAAAQR